MQVMSTGRHTVLFYTAVSSDILSKMYTVFKMYNDTVGKYAYVHERFVINCKHRVSY